MLVEQLLSLLLQKQDPEVDITTKLSIVNALSLAFNLPDIRDELMDLLAEEHSSLLHHITNKKFDHNTQTTSEMICLLQRLAKNYPQWLLSNFQTAVQSYLARQLFPASTERKKAVAVLKICEEWIKNYKSESLTPADEDECEESKGSQSESPYLVESFRDLMNEIVQAFLVGGAQETSIAVLSILNNLDCHQWRLVFSPEVTKGLILNFIYQAGKAQPLVKAACMKMLGYMVYFDMRVVLEDPVEYSKFLKRVH